MENEERRPDWLFLRIGAIKLSQHNGVVQMRLDPGLTEEEQSGRPGVTALMFANEARDLAAQLNAIADEADKPVPLPPDPEPINSTGRR